MQTNSKSIATDITEQELRNKGNELLRKTFSLFLAASLPLALNFAMPEPFESYGGLVFFAECLVWCGVCVWLNACYETRTNSL